ncbi:MAG: hypothetical protein Harvfovirus58_5 [Harvfovirus sp.]|uniref:Uncharacterized protein n=1 Tax=Harvfovirus sp. TaxID=2487768 RepID=A0A3G5A3F7_9VIRU|nr:MAG: hypothetical protein Harvfovirus58_5 [Harvfovirus sp.]
MVDKSQEEYNKQIMDTGISEEKPVEPVEIDLSEYHVPEDKKTEAMYVDILNIFNIYFRYLFNKEPTSTLFEGIDHNDPTATNRPLEKLYEEINNYKNTKDSRLIDIFDPILYRETYLSGDDDVLPEDHPFYLVDVDGDQKVTHNLITALKYISATNWQSNSWAINQVNEF